MLLISLLLLLDGNNKFLHPCKNLFLRISCKARNSKNIIFTYYEPNRFFRYVDLSEKNIYYISKVNRFEYQEQPERILENIKASETVSVVFLDSVSFFDEDFVNKNKDNSKIPEMFLTFSHIKNSLIKDLNKNFTDFKVDKLGAWTVISAKKLK